MALYEFKCADGHISERIMNYMKAERIGYVVCDVCNKPASRVEFSVPAPAKFVGTGWYKPSSSD